MADAVEVLAPMPAKIVELMVAEGDTVEAEQELLIIESMKMEVPVTAPVAGTVSEIRVAEGDTVDPDAVLVVIQPA
jgi:biotin carboxyl carrier protein